MNTALKRFGLAAFASVGLVVFASQADAQTCSWTVLANGTTADANAVMDNFNCLAQLSGANFTGNVGIGTTAPGFPLDVWAGTADQIRVRSLGANRAEISIDNQAGGNQSAILFLDAGVSKWQIGKQSDNSFFEYDNPNALGFLSVTTAGQLSLGEGGQIQVQKLGYVGIGQATPLNSLDIADIHGTLPPTSGTTQAGSILTETGDVGLTVGIDNNSPFAGWIQVANKSALNVNYDLLLNPNGGTVGVGTTSPSTSYVFEVVGATGASAASWNVVSDARLKDHVIDLSNGLAIIDQLRPVRFDWSPVEKRTVGKDLKLPVDKPQVGFIAQEVEKVLPEAVTAPAKGSVDPYGMQESKLIPVLVEAIKEQQAEIKGLEKQVTAQQAQIAALNHGR